MRATHLTELLLNEHIVKCVALTPMQLTPMQVTENVEKVVLESERIAHEKTKRADAAFHKSMGK